MKRYRIEHRHPYADDPECIEEVAVEDEAGNWVPADDAQALVDALEHAAKALYWVLEAEGHYTCDEDLQWYREVLAKVGRNVDWRDIG